MRISDWSSDVCSSDLKEIDPRYGSWEDVERISSEYDLSLDLMINHLSDESEEFKDFLKLGYRSEYADLFVHVDQMGDISPDDMARIHIRKEKEPFREVTRSEEHTSELQSLMRTSYAVFCLNKKTVQQRTQHINN